MKVSKETLEAIHTVVAEELGNVRILAVNVQEDLDHDGDPVLRVEVVCEAIEGRLNAKKVVGLARHLREPLAMLKETRFPVFTFKTGDEYHGQAA